MNTTTTKSINCAAILPSLNPTEKLCAVIDGLIGEGFRDIILVDDGSDEEHLQPFELAQKLPQVTLLRHEVNQGKGAALKTAFRYLSENRPDIDSAVTADGDGQHLPKDILACALALEENKDALILGCRDFNLPNVPSKSRKGNKITSFAFRTGCGIRLSDTQTGLRAVNASLFPALTEISGNRYEYETNMLLELHRKGVPFREVTITTVYEDNNSGSHFRPVRDSILIYKLIIKYMASSFASAGIDLLAFLILHALLGGLLSALAVPICTALSRAISSFVNFNLNKKLVFGANGKYSAAMARYYILCILQLIVSAGLVYLLGKLFVTDSSWLLTLLKAVVDTALFFVSFHIQREWVFGNSE
ncbi:MAG: bifunctional glycosyltransferase family 2/GtrA family protein [Clostridiales bacterium]|nr:bifunctional glycosyltransferase family 2/GtrA family protein [Clostridiales bacterium]